MDRASAHEWREEAKTMRENVARAREGLSRADDRVQRFVRGRPVTALFAALTAGFLLGRIMARR